MTDVDHSPWGHTKERRVFTERVESVEHLNGHQHRQRQGAGLHLALIEVRAWVRVEDVPASQPHNTHSPLLVSHRGWIEAHRGWIEANGGWIQAQGVDSAINGVHSGT